MLPLQPAGPMSRPIFTIQKNVLVLDDSGEGWPGGEKEKRRKGGEGEREKKKRKGPHVRTRSMRQAIHW